MKILLIISLLFFSEVVNAQTIETNYINENNVIMTNEQYEKLNTIYGNGMAEKIDQETFNSLLEKLQYEIVETDKIYIKTSSRYDILGNLMAQSNTLLTEEEYSNSVNENAIAPASYCGNGSECWQTDYKTLNITAQKKSTNNYYITTSLTWNKFPSKRNYDLIGIWFPTQNTGNSYSNPYSYMYYTKSGSSTTTSKYSNITQTWSGNGTDAWAYSHNLPEGTLSQLKIIEEVTLTTKSGVYQNIRGAYQHATTSNTLNGFECVSTLSQNGYGQMFLMKSSCSSYFDQMQGVYLTLTT